jgi:hypothetical protein
MHLEQRHTASLHLQVSLTDAAPNARRICAQKSSSNVGRRANADIGPSAKFLVRDSVHGMRTVTLRTCVTGPLSRHAQNHESHKIYQRKTRQRDPNCQLLRCSCSANRRTHFAGLRSAGDCDEPDHREAGAVWIRRNNLAGSGRVRVCSCALSNAARSLTHLSPSAPTLDTERHQWRHKYTRSNGPLSQPSSRYRIYSSKQQMPSKLKTIKCSIDIAQHNTNLGFTSNVTEVLLML